MFSQMMGAAILAFPYVVHQVGWILIAVILIHSVIGTYICVNHFTEACFFTTSKSYKDLTMKILGKKFAIIIDIALIISYYGSMTAYIIISTNAVVNFVQNHFGYTITRWVMKVCIACFIMFPLCLLKSLEQLSKISAISGLVILAFAGTIVAYFLIKFKSQTLCVYNDGEKMHQIKFGLSALPNASISQSVLFFLMYVPYIYSNFSAHPVFPRFLVELEGPYKKRKTLVRKALILALIMSLLVCCLAGYMGADIFGQDIQQNVLHGFDPCKFLWTDILELFYAVVVIVNFPLVLYPLKTSLVSSFGSPIETKKGYKMSIIIDIIFVAATLALGLFMEKIVSIFGLFQSLAGFFFYFFIPVYCYIVGQKLQKDNLQLNQLDEHMSMPGLQEPEIKSSEIEMKASKAQNIENEEYLHSDVMGKEQVDVKVNSGTEIKIDKNLLNKVQNKRKIIGFAIIGIYGVVCSVGVVMNGIDIVNGFLHPNE